MLERNKKILELLKEGKTPKEVAELLGIKTQTVYQATYDAKKRARKKRLAKTLAAVHPGVSKKKITLTKKAPSEIYRWINVSKADPQSVIDNLRHEIVGYKAVISYLEHQLGLMNSQ